MKKVNLENALKSLNEVEDINLYFIGLAIFVFFMFIIVKSNLGFTMSSSND